MDNKQLMLHAANIRKNILTAVHAPKSGHPGGSLSVCDLLTLLYFEVMNVDPKNPTSPSRDRFVLSKGHAAPALYSTLAERGFFPTDDLCNFRKFGSILQGHPVMYVPGVDVATGSLGQGISAANGMAIAGKLDKSDYRVYTVLGDGECQEGQVWEAAMFAGHYKLDNLCAFVDHNHLQIDGKVEDVMNPTPIDEKFKAFGWNVLTCDGHDFDQLRKAVNSAKSYIGKPTVVILNTVKGKGVSFMENQVNWHGSAPNDEQYKQAIDEIDQYIKTLGGAL